MCHYLIWYNVILFYFPTMQHDHRRQLTLQCKENMAFITRISRMFSSYLFHAHHVVRQLLCTIPVSRLPWKSFTRDRSY